MGVWVTWLIFRTSERARLIDAKIVPLSSKTLLFLFTNYILKLKLTCPYIYIRMYNIYTTTASTYKDKFYLFIDLLACFSQFENNFSRMYRFYIFIEKFQNFLLTIQLIE